MNELANLPLNLSDLCVTLWNLCDKKKSIISRRGRRGLYAKASKARELLNIKVSKFPSLIKEQIGKPTSKP